SLRSLGLIDADGRPTDDYGELRLSRPRRQAALVRCLRRAHPGLPASDGSEIGDDHLPHHFVAEHGLTRQKVGKALRLYPPLAAATGPAAAPDREGSRPISPRPAGQRPSLGLGASAQSSASPREVESTMELLVGAPSSIQPGEVQPGLTVVVQVPIDATEEQLVQLFRRVRRAWEKAQGQ